jgi:hypothetical protein
MMQALAFLSAPRLSFASAIICLMYCKSCLLLLFLERSRMTIFWPVSSWVSFYFKYIQDMYLRKAYLQIRTVGIRIFVSSED